jgi:hypothetical protein
MANWIRVSPHGGWRELSIAIIIIISIFKFTFRFISGRDLLHPANQRPTDATFLRRGTRQFNKKDRLTFWAFMPEWQRGVIRTGILLCLILWIEGYFLGYWLDQWIAVGCLCFGIGWGIFKLWRNHRYMKLRREYVVPLGGTLAPILDQNVINVSDWVNIPRSFVGLDKKHIKDMWKTPAWIPTWVWVVEAGVWVKRLIEPPSETATIQYPKDLPITKDVRDIVMSTIPMKLGSSQEWDIQFHGVGSKPYISIKIKPQPPDLVRFGEVQHDLAKMKESELLVGRSASNVVAIDFDTDAPHLAASCGSGAGKSELLKGLIAQILHKGHRVIILDNKRVSQNWCKDHPSVMYCRTGAEIHEALTALSEEVTKRFDKLNDLPPEGDVNLDVGQRVFCIFEEQNIGMQALAEHWQKIRVKGDPPRSPAMSALDHALCAGRQAKIHVISVAQLFTVRSCGGNPAARENYGPRLLARATVNAWKMLAPECAPFPKIGNRRGRMALAFSGEVTVLQAVLWTVSEAREWAFMTAPVAAVTVPDVRHQVSPVTSTPPATRLVSLAEAARDGVVSLSYGSLRNAKSTATNFPEPIDGKYVARDLEEWDKQRKAS